MLSCQSIRAGMTPEYFAADGYYTRTMSQRDIWQGELAQAMGLQGEVTKDQFAALHDQLVEDGRDRRVGMDLCFSAPKSVSLAMAESAATREAMQQAHFEAVQSTINYIEKNDIKTRVTENGRTRQVKTQNCVAALFQHQTNRNGDLDLHTHSVIQNMTIYKGQMYAIEFKDVLHDQKEIGLFYRQQLAKNLQKQGYELEITDRRQGFFELKNFDREMIMEHSSRRVEILAEMERTGGTTATDAQKATLKTRRKKKKFDIQDLYDEVQKELFSSGKVKIERKVIDNENHKSTNTGDIEKRVGTDNPSRFTGEPNIGTNGFNAGRGLEKVTIGHSLQDLSQRGMDTPKSAVNRVLPRSPVSRLASYQSGRVRNIVLQREEQQQRQQRITEIANETIKTLESERYAFTIPETRRRIMAAGVLENISKTEAEKAMEAAGLVKLGKLEREGKQSRDVYVTTDANIKREAAIIDRMNQGKGQVQSLSQAQSEAAFDKLKATKEARGQSFTPNEEQTIAIHHVLTNTDRNLCIQGLAGTGKTYTMTSIREICDQQGIMIRGMAFTGKAADGLEDESNIKSSTIHSFLNKLEKGEFNEKNKTLGAAQELAADALSLDKYAPQSTGVDGAIQNAKELAAEALLPRELAKAAKAEIRAAEREAKYEQQKKQQQQEGIKQSWDFSGVQKATKREIWIVDEAGLLDNKLIEQVQLAAEARGAQVVLSGDYQQLLPVGAGEPMRHMIEAGAGTAFMEDIRRQQNIELLTAVKESVQGDTIKTFEILNKAGYYRAVKDTTKRQEAVRDEMTTTKLQNYKEGLLLVSTNSDRKNYNKLIRQEYVKRGEIEQGKEYKITARDGEKEAIEKRNFAVNDRIIFTANDNKIDVKNGTLGTITNIENNKFTVRTDAGKTKNFYIDRYKDIDHSYAVTVYKSQGMGVKKIVADMNTKSRAQDRNCLYVIISRAKERAIVFTDSKKKLEKQTLEFLKKISGKNFSEKVQSMERGNRIQNNDRYKAPEKITTEKITLELKKEPQSLVQNRALELQKEKQIQQEKEQTLQRESRLSR